MVRTDKQGRGYEERTAPDMPNERTAMMYFPDSTHASSLKVVQEPTSQIRGFYFKKSLLAEVEKLEHANNYAVYFLISDVDEPSIYIGQSIHGIKRLKEHLKQKDFWQFGILFVTDNNSFDKQLIDFLEYEFIQRFNASTYIVENRDMRINKPNVNWYMAAAMNTFAGQITFLLEALGVTIKQAKQVESYEEERIYYPAEKNHPATIYLHDGQFVITKGSTVLFPQEKLKHYKDEGKLYQKLKAKINQLIQANQAEPIDEKSARLTEDIVCPSPSYAADLCSGASKNGWEYWQGLREERERLG